MQYFLFFLIIISSIIIGITEKENENDKNQTKNEILNQTDIIKKNKTLNQTLNKTENITLNEKKSKNRKIGLSPNFEDNLSYDNGSITNREVYNLNDFTFDMLVQNGNNFKWLIILYSEDCGHCQYARREIRKIFSSYRNNTKIRFAEIEINRNIMTNMRFNIEGVPYIFLLQNNSIYEMDLYPNEKNLKKFIETDFKDVADELKPFPPMVSPFKVGWEFIKNIFRGITNIINEILYDKGYDFEFTPFLLIISVISFFCSICLLEYFCFSRFCPDKDEKKKTKEEVEKEKEEKTEEEKKEEFKEGKEE